MRKNGLIAGLFGVLSIFIAFSLSAKEDSGHEAQHAQEAHADDHHGESGDYNPVPEIMHHIADSYEWHVWGDIHLPLPIIAYNNGSLDVFMSSKLSHGHTYKGYSLDHGHLVYHDEEGHEKHAATLFGLIQHPEEQFIDLSITRNVASMILSIVLILLLFGSTARAYSKEGVPKGIAKFMEPLVLFVRDDIAVPNIGEKKAHRFMGYLLTVFFFIWINNMIGLVPFFPGASNLSGNIAFTAVLAIFTLIITNVSGTKDYWSHIFLPHVPKWMYPIMWPVEIIGIFTKPFALLLRLFANITAGHILILSLVSLIFILESAAVSLVSVPFMIFMFTLELLVAALQAYIFTLLSALFIGMAVEEHHDHVAEEVH